jgi:NhaA family Na+:H+ antiporter
MNPWGIAVHGFGIPMATDIAFGLGILTLLHKRVPKSLFVFFLSFAIVDDIGAVLLIALFYSKNLSLFYLTLALMVTAVLVLLNLFGVRGSAFYLLFGVGLWYLTLKSGIHATVAGILLAAAIPSKPKFNTFKFSLKLRGLLREFDSHHPTEKTFFPTPEQRAILRALGEGIKQAEPPLVRLEHSLHAPVAFLVMPLFALVNAGTKISLGDLGTIFSHPVTLGVSFGLVAGKFVGILGAAWISQKLGIARLPNGMNFRYVVAAALLGGIGFTMSIFIAELAFEHFPEFLWASKLGILLASFLAGTLGFWVLRREPVLITGEEPSRSSGEEESD